MGRLIIGNNFPISVQTMWKQPLEEIDAALEKVEFLGKIGCDLLRFSVPDIEAVRVVGLLASKTEIPLVADVHFDYRIALVCLDYPISKIRINPGNIGAEWKIEELVKKAKDKNIPLRIGINAGSLPKIVRKETNRAKAMLQAAEMELEILDRLNFSQAIFSLKASDVESTVQANLLFSESYDLPLHLGVTEAGPLVQGVVKNTLALSRLLCSGVGDTVRISLSDTMENEIAAGRAILQSTGIRSDSVEIVSCPTCARTTFDVKKFLDLVEIYIQSMDKTFTLAVMGCPVNGPGEAKHADIGITGSGNSVLIFKKGKLVTRVAPENAVEAFKKEVETL